MNHTAEVVDTGAGILEALLRDFTDGGVVFKNLDSEEIAMLSDSLNIQKYPAGATVFSEGEEADFMGFVVSGRLKVTKRLEFKGNKIVLAILARGSFAGEFSMIDGLPRTASIDAMEDSVLLVMQRKALEAFINRNPDVGIKILKGIIASHSIRHNRTAERLLAFM